MILYTTVTDGHAFCVMRDAWQVSSFKKSPLVKQSTKSSKNAPQPYSVS